MLAVAWSEGKLLYDDLLTIKNYLAGVIKLNDEDKHSLNLYKEYAIEPMERRRLARRFAQRYTTAIDRRELVERLESLLKANGSPDKLKKTLAIQEIKEAIVEDQINFIKKVQYKLTRTPFPAKISDVGREVYLQEYKSNPMFFRLKLRLGENFQSINLSQMKAEKLCLEMTLLGLVIYADQILLPEELVIVTKYLEDVWMLDENVIEMIITMALCRELNEAQVGQFSCRYRELSTFDERQRLYLMLGKIARADHQVTKGEQEVLEQIANALEIAPGVRRSVLEDAVRTEAAIE